MPVDARSASFCGEILTQANGLYGSRSHKNKKLIEELKKVAESN